jgi:3D (Asp-Asp-Asp) domain-containing protein
VLLAYPSISHIDTPRSAIHAQVSRGTQERQYLGTFEATAYCLRGETKSGVQAGHGRIAVDPDTVPLGARLFIEGYGEAIAVDAGSEIKGRELDLWFSDYETCINYGRRQVRVWKERTSL